MVAKTKRKRSGGAPTKKAGSHAIQKSVRVSPDLMACVGTLIDNDEGKTFADVIDRSLKFYIKRRYPGLLERVREARRQDPTSDLQLKLSEFLEHGPQDASQL